MCGSKGVKGSSAAQSQIWGLAAEKGPSCSWKQAEVLYREYCARLILGLLTNELVLFKMCGQKRKPVDLGFEIQCKEYSII